MVLCMANAANIIRADAAACALRPQATLYYSWKQLHGLGRDRPVINMHRLAEKPGVMFHVRESMSLPPVIAGAHALQESMDMNMKEACYTMGSLHYLMQHNKVPSNTTLLMRHMDSESDGEMCRAARALSYEYKMF